MPLLLVKYFAIKVKKSSTEEKITILINGKVYKTHISEVQVLNIVPNY